MMWSELSYFAALVWFYTLVALWLTSLSSFIVGGAVYSSACCAALPVALLAAIIGDKLVQRYRYARGRLKGVPDTWGKLPGLIPVFPVLVMLPGLAGFGISWLPVVLGSILLWLMVIGLVERRRRFTGQQKNTS